MKSRKMSPKVRSFRKLPYAGKPTAKDEVVVGVSEIRKSEREARQRLERLMRGEPREEEGGES
jgi:hypothetical protein